MLAVVLAAAGLAAVAQSPEYGNCVTSEQLRHYQTASDPQLSPDGTQAVWVQHESTADGAATHLWLAPTNGAAPARQITFSPPDNHTGESSPQWTPDGSAILFTAKRGPERQIFRLPLAGGEGAPIELKAGKLALSPGGFEVSPDGRWLAIRAGQPLTAAQKKDRKDKKDAVVVGEDKNPNRIWLYSFADHSVVALTPLSREARGMAWSPDSMQLAIITADTGNADERGPNNRLEIVAVAHPRQPRELAGAPASIARAAFSPDGRQLAFLAQSEHDTPPGISDLYVMPVAGGTPRDLSGSSGFAVSGRGLTWRQDGSAIYVEVQHQTRDALLAFPLTGGAPEWQPAATPIANGFGTNRKQTGWVFTAQATNQMPQIEYARTPAGQGAVLSDVNPDWAAQGWRAATGVSWLGPDNLTIHGLYFQAARCSGAAPLRAGKSPMILVAHGGPTGAFVETFSPYIQWLTSQGWAVLEVNPRGSTGYGWQFAAADRNDLGGKDFQDEMTGVDWALAHRPVDASRLGMYGYSYGGEMAGFIEGKTDRFAAIVGGAPVIDQYSEYGTEGGSWYDRWFFGQPWLRAQDAWRQSPLAYAKDAKTPLLLLQGQADTTDPLGQSEEMYRALRQEGVPVRLMTFPRENHGPLSGGINGAPSREPWHGFEARTQILAWYKDHFAAGAGAGAGR